MPYNLSNNEIIRNFEFEDVTKEGEEDFFKYNFSFDITDSKGTLILDYDGYIFEGDRDYELEWGQKKPEDWKKADTEILIDALEDWKNIKMAKGGGVGKTLAPKSDRIFGSEKNAKGSASSEKSASKISLSAKIIKALENKLEDFKKTNKTKKVSLNDLKAVYRRGLGAYSSSHRPTISGGKPNTRNAWAMARVNKFLLKAGGTKVKKAYVQDDDLLKMADGGMIYEVGIDNGKDGTRTLADFEKEKDAEKFMYDYNLTNPNAKLFIDTVTSDSGYMAKGGMMTRGGEIYKIQAKYKFALQPKWEDEKFQTGGRYFLSFKQAQDFKKKLQGQSSYYMEYKVVKVEEKMADGGDVGIVCKGRSCDKTTKTDDTVCERGDAYGIFTGYYCDDCYENNYPYRRDRYFDESYAGERMDDDYAEGGKISGKGSEWAFWAGLLGWGVLSYIGINKK